uniref:EOG090X0B17 n=1 Tax=Daphnia pulex TaxID=6669 RepID=A0A4Y7MWQ0_DAPPU|nr:EOG090X0B17 [Daphnia pulex]SVE85055.1 EOG090X0B17 [Daphnia pulex]
MKGVSNLIFAVIIFAVVIINIESAPVDPKKSTEKPSDANGVGDAAGVSTYLQSLVETGLEYNRYLQEVVQLLESDPDFRQKLEKSDPEDIRTGKVAKELEYVNHHVRNKLDELKRQEMERLRHLAMEEYERARGLGIPHDGRLKIPGHLDHKSPSFESEDLRKLIVQTSKDLEEADKQRKEEFKEYEMQKEFEHQNKLKGLDEEKRKTEEKEWEEAQAKHKQHPKMHHPGSKQQLEEVWEEQDHLSPDSFNPKTFFALHDLDGNGYWDPDEVKALFSKELDKAYDPNAPEDDMAERYEEMERMREHVFNETDTNRDYLISFPEFLEQTRKQEFERDPGWNTIDEQPVYSQQEYMEFEHQRQMEIQRLIDQGMLPPHPGMMPNHPRMPNVPYGVAPGQYAGQQPYYPSPVAQGKPITPEEAIRMQQQQYAQQPQFAPQQQYYGQPQFAQQQQYAGHPQQQFAANPQYAAQPQQPQFAQPEQQNFQQAAQQQQQNFQQASQQQQPIQQQKYFDSGDYQMAKQKGPAKIPTAAATAVIPPANLGHPTGDAIPTPESVPTRKTSIIQSKLANVTNVKIDYIFGIGSLNTYGKWICWMKRESNKATGRRRRSWSPKNTSINAKPQQSRFTDVETNGVLSASLWTLHERNPFIVIGKQLQIKLHLYHFQQTPLFLEHL